MNSTRHLASPVTRGNFFYGSDFYVEIPGSGGFRKERFTRESSGSLYSLLTYTPPSGPTLTKAGKVAKRQPSPYRDRTGPFYCAQLIHYGLKQYKTKEAAKKHLLQAFDADHQLQVPESILLVEKELKEEYDKANLEAGRLYEERRLLERERVRKEQEERSRKNAALMKQLKEISETKVAGTDESGATVERLSDKALRDAIKVMPEGDLRKIVAKVVKDVPELRDAVELQISRSQKTTQKATKGKSAVKSINNLKDREFRGRFDVAIPFMSEQWSQFPPDELFTLKICKSMKSSHLWGKFDFGGISGVLRSTSSPLPESFPAGFKVEFLWRGEEFGEGESSFGKDNKGYIVFLGDRRIKGLMHWMGNFDFVGKYDTEQSQNVVWVKSIPHWKSEWRSYNQHNYDVANTARWGNWGGDTRNEEEADSDTSAGKGTSGSDDEEDFDMEDSSDSGYQGRFSNIGF